MLSTPPGPPRLAGYDLREPTESDVAAALRRVFGTTRGTERWTQVCRDAGLVPGEVSSTLLLNQVVKVLSAAGGACAMVARSVEIRQRTWARLAATAGRQG
jgi:hypothetical protein